MRCPGEENVQEEKGGLGQRPLALNNLLSRKEPVKIRRAGHWDRTKVQRICCHGSKGCKGESGQSYGIFLRGQVR